MLSFRPIRTNPVRARNAASGKSGSSRRTPEILRIEMMSVGECLTDALKIERKFGNIDTTEVGDEALREWKERRRAVERQVEEYALAVARWRRSLEEDLAKYPGAHVSAHRDTARNPVACLA